VVQHARLDAARIARSGAGRTDGVNLDRPGPGEVRRRARQAANRRGKHRSGPAAAGDQPGSAAAGAAAAAVRAECRGVLLRHGRRQHPFLVDPSPQFDDIDNDPAWLALGMLLGGIAKLADALAARYERCRAAFSFLDRRKANVHRRACLERADHRNRRQATRYTQGTHAARPAQAVRPAHHERQRDRPAHPRRHHRALASLDRTRHLLLAGLRHARVRRQHRA
jgi:hypothetical protein